MGDVLFLFCRQCVMSQEFIERVSHTQQCAKTAGEHNKRGDSYLPSGDLQFNWQPFFSCIIVIITVIVVITVLVIVFTPLYMHLLDIQPNNRRLLFFRFVQFCGMESVAAPWDLLCLTTFCLKLVHCVHFRR